MGVVERKHGLSTEQVPVSAYVGSSKNLKDLKVQLRRYTCHAITGRGISRKASGERRLRLRGSCWVKSNAGIGCELSPDGPGEVSSVLGQETSTAAPYHPTIGLCPGSWGDPMVGCFPVDEVPL